MTIRDATPGDLAAIAIIQAASPEAAQWNPADYLAHHCCVALLGNSVTRERVAGFIVVRETTAGEREILNLAVHPAQRRQGIARALVDAELRASGVWFLEVRESNMAALTLYQKLGFRASGRRPSYYRDPTETAIVLTRHS